MLTKASFTRDEWNLLRFFNLMNFSMFSCRHFSNFLSDPIRKQSAMSKRGQEATSSEGLPMAKPKPMNSAMAKSRPMSLVLQIPLGARKKPPQDLSNPVNRVNVEKEQDGAPCIRKLMRNPSQDPIEYPQVKRPENTQNADSWKQEDRDESSGSTSTRKLGGEHTKEFHNMWISNHQCLTKVFQHLQKKLRITTGHSTFAIESIRTNVSIWGLFMSSSMKAAINLVCKNTNFEEIQVLFNMTQKIIWEHSGAVLNVHTIVKVLIPHGRDRHCLPLKQLLCDLRLTAKFESL